MTIHKLSAGSGYEYLTRQVAALDSTELGDMPLADYYASKGEAPGRWVGTGLEGLGNRNDPDRAVVAGDVVTSEQMQHLFGAAEDPVTGLALGRRPRADGVAGFDLTFSPVKSVSALWAVASPEVARAIEQAHRAAVAHALAYVEREVLCTREGTDGARQVETRGLIAAAFQHRDSRSGDPDLHTHVAVANKVQARTSGKWLTVYGALLFQHTVAISETYNTALEARLHEALGVEFKERPTADGRRTVREIVGVDADLCKRWSRRGSEIDERERDLVAEFVRERGRPPSEKERLGLVQRANLETRSPKHEPRSEAEQRATWRHQAADLLGGESAIGRMVRTAIHPPSFGQHSVSPMDSSTIQALAAATVAELEAHRATWQVWHLRAEAERQVRAAASGTASAAALPGLVDDVVAAAKQGSVLLTPDHDPGTYAGQEPALLRRSDGTSVYRHTGADYYTSQRILEAEDRIVRTASLRSDFAFSTEEIEVAIRKHAVTGVPLNRGQQELVHAMAGSTRRVRLALAAAGTGKTTAVRVLTQIWTGNGYDAIGLAPSAAAAAVLGEATGIATDTLAKLNWEILTPEHPNQHRLSDRIDAGTLVVIDEAGLGDTLTLDRVIGHCLTRGATVRLLGDNQQLAAVGAGGALRDIADQHGAERLTDVVRFTDPAEAHATLDLRDGDPAALGFYLDHDRIHATDQNSTITEVLDAWRRARTAGQDSLMLAPTRDLVADLNQRAREDRLGGTTPRAEIDLADGNQASVGDTVLTRYNNRRLRVSRTDWVKNGDRWTVTKVRNDELTVRHTRTGLRAQLPAWYVAEHVELGYASTVHTAQGMTADIMHGIVTGSEDRQMLYTMLTRGREENHAHIVTDPTEAADECGQWTLPCLDEQLNATQTLEAVIARDGAAVSARTALRRGTSHATQIHTANTRYLDAVTTAAQHAYGCGWEDALEAAGEGPLPWLPATPTEVASDKRWGPYIAAIAEHLTTTATAFTDEHQPTDASAQSGGWMARYGGGGLLGDLQTDIALWRAAHGVPDNDRRPTGPPLSDDTAARYQRHLLRQINDRHDYTTRLWEERIVARTGNRDDRTIDVAQMLDRLHRSGRPAARILDVALQRGPLPEDHASSALACRIRQLTAQHPDQQRPRKRPGAAMIDRPQPPATSVQSTGQPGLGL